MVGNRTVHRPDTAGEFGVAIEIVQHLPVNVGCRLDGDDIGARRREQGVVADVRADVDEQIAGREAAFDDPRNGGFPYGLFTDEGVEVVGASLPG